MPYCHNCGTELSRDALYCPNCGTKIVMDKSSVNGVPSEEMKEALTRMSIEFEKAFNVAAKQVQIAFKTAKENMQKAMYKEPLVCSDCGEKNPSNAAYCHKCGHGLLSVQDSTKQNENPAQDSNAS